MNVLAVYFSIPRGRDPSDIPFLPWLVGAVVVVLIGLWVVVEITDWLRRR